MLTEIKAGQAFRPGLLVVMVELPGIEPVPENALNSRNAGFDDAEVRQTTREHVGKREGC